MQAGAIIDNGAEVGAAISSMKDLGKIEQMVLRESANRLKKSVNATLRSRFPKAWSTKHGGRIAKGLTSSVRKSKYPDRDGSRRYYSMVSILGKRKDSGGSDRSRVLKYFEYGAESREARQVNTKTVQLETIVHTGKNGRTYTRHHLKTVTKHSGLNRGTLKPLWFFRDTVNADGGKILSEMKDETLDLVINKWNAKH